MDEEALNQVDREIEDEEIRVDDEKLEAQGD